MHNVFVYLCLTCFNFFFWRMRAHEFFRFCFFLWSKFNFFCLHLFLIFFFSAPCSMEDFEAETLKCTFFLHKVEINFKFFFHVCCVPICSCWRLSSFIQSGYSTDPKLSNRTWAIRGNLYVDSHSSAPVDVPFISNFLQLEEQKDSNRT